jgi:putative aldouronate transport system permease protein
MSLPQNLFGIKYFGTKSEKIIFNTLNTAFMIGLSFIMLYPFWNTIAISFNEAVDTVRGGVTFWPRRFTMQNYKTVFASGTIYNAFFVSVARTLINMIVNVFFTAMLAYTLSRREYVLRKPFTFIVILSMYVNAGLIPNYFLMRSLGLVNSFFVYIVPGIISAFNFVVIRTYIRTVPESIVESAKLDGCGDFMIFVRMVLPLCIPVLATIMLFVSVDSWNAWFDTMIYNSGRTNLHTLQYKLMEYLQSSQASSRSTADAGAMALAQGSGSSQLVTPVSIRAAITVVAAAPILVVYPFMQRYFVTGLNVGGVKE